MSVSGEREQVALRVVTDGASEEQSGGFDGKRSYLRPTRVLSVYNSFA